MDSIINVVLDVDTGVDDAHALLLALRHPQLNVLAVTTVAGNSDVDTCTRATLKVLDAAEAPMDLPVAKGCATPLVEPTHYCPQIHGTDALGDLTPPLPTSTRTIVPEHAVTFLMNLLRQRIATQQPPFTLIALAPLTNIGMLVRLAPDLVRRGISKIVWMGGACCAGGNASAWSEANAAYDPEAAHIVLSSCGVPVLMYTWDVYLKVDFNVAELRSYGCMEAVNDKEAKGEKEEKEEQVHYRAATPPWTQLSTRLLLRDMQHFKMSSAQIGDAGAVAAVLCENAAETRHLHVAVELEGKHTRGMTVCDVREGVCPPDTPQKIPNVYVAVGVDAAALKACYASVVFPSTGTNTKKEEPQSTATTFTTTASTSPPTTSIGLTTPTTSTSTSTSTSTTNNNNNENNTTRKKCVPSATKC